MLHFAYGSNMHRAVMRRHAPGAQPLHPARLEGHRFVITMDGYASLVPDRRRCVHGLLWRLTARDRVTLDLWENVAAGLYRAEMLPVKDGGGGRRRVLVYVARQGPLGGPRPGYMEIVVKAARELQLPADYIALLEEWLPQRRLGAGHRRLEEFGEAL
ncbi:MAG: gamma-glutamylcyclotransferase family protein [Xanthobacteraceae bacterium]|jgi:AIG2-like family